MVYDQIFILAFPGGGGTIQPEVVSIVIYGYHEETPGVAASGVSAVWLGGRLRGSKEDCLNCPMIRGGCDGRGCAGKQDG